MRTQSKPEYVLDVGRKIYMQ